MVALLLGLLSARAWAQGAEPGMLGKLTPLMPHGTVTRGFTYIDVADRSEYIYTYTVGAVQSRIVLIQAQNPRIYLLFPYIDEKAIADEPAAPHNGYFMLLAEDKGKLRKVFDSYQAFGERVLNKTQIGFADLDGSGVKDMVVATQFSTAQGGLSSSMFVYAWNGKRFEQTVRERQQGEWCGELRLVPTVPNGHPDIYVERPSGASDRMHYWWLYAYMRGNLHRLGWEGPVPGRSWIAEIGPSHSYRIITARWDPMDTPDGTFMDKSEVTFWRYGGGELAPGERFYTFHNPYELTREVPRTVDIPDDLWAWYFSPSIRRHLAHRQVMDGEVKYALFPEESRSRTALNFRMGGTTYTALAYTIYDVKHLGDPDPDVDQYLIKLPYPHQHLSEFPEGSDLECTRRLQVKVMTPSGDDYRDVWTSQVFPEHQAFEGFEVSGSQLYLRLRVRGDIKKIPLPFR
ncbi:MAG: hypothetical protein ACYCW6_04365 [Candidatus Xenobia bacterium]